jgi:hypothetical protein
MWYVYEIPGTSKDSALLQGVNIGSRVQLVPVQCALRLLSSGEKLSEREANHSPHLLPRLRMYGARAYAPTPPFVFIAWR